MNRPNAYQTGAAFLQEQYGPERLRQDGVAEWERFRDHPTQQASNRATAEFMTRGITNATERDARQREVLDQLSAPPGPKRWCLAACAYQAIQGLLEGMADEHHDAKAQAILLLAVMLWDAEADKRHPIFSVFGAWGATPAGRFSSLSRWVAASFLSTDVNLRRWMDTVRMAWIALPRSDRGRVEPQSRDVLVDDFGFCAPKDIAKRIGVPEKVDAIRMMLKRLLEENCLPDGAWIENANPATGQAKILYNFAMVRPLLSRYES